MANEVQPICGIYMLQCQITGDRYIGQSVDILRRYGEHKAPHAYPPNKLHSDMQKLGVKNFDLLVLEECPREFLDEREIYWIAHLNPEYNLCIGGKGAKGYKPTPEQKEISRQAALKQWREMDEENKQRIIKNNLTGHRKGYKMSEETKRKLVESHKGKKWTPELREKIAEAKRIKKENGYRQLNQGHKKPVICTTTSETFESVKAAGEHFGISPTCITAVLKGKHKATHNLHFIYGERKTNNGE